MLFHILTCLTASERGHITPQRLVPASQRTEHSMPTYTVRWLSNVRTTEEKANDLRRSLRSKNKRRKTSQSACIWYSAIDTTGWRILVKFGIAVLHEKWWSDRRFCNDRRADGHALGQRAAKFRARGLFLASKNHHGFSHPCSRKYGVSGWQVTEIRHLYLTADFMQPQIQTSKKGKGKGHPITGHEGTEGGRDIFDIDIDIFVNCNWVNTRWQWYSTHNQYIGQHK